jgi:CelD/BcsL family acetyltransferase involved in cellulose biosynthesis
MVSYSHTEVRSVGADGTVERRADIAQIAPEWDALADRVGAAPFLRPGWLGAWLEAFPAGRPAILTVREGGELKGVLPLLRGSALLTSPSNSHTPLFGPVVEGPDRRARWREQSSRHARRAPISGPSTRRTRCSRSSGRPRVRPAARCSSG